MELSYFRGPIHRELDAVVLAQLVGQLEGMIEVGHVSTELITNGSAVDRVQFDVLAALPAVPKVSAVEEGLAELARAVASAVASSTKPRQRRSEQIAKIVHEDVENVITTSSVEVMGKLCEPAFDPACQALTSTHPTASEGAP